MNWVRTRRRPGFGFGWRVTSRGLKLRLGMLQFSLGSIPDRVFGVGQEITLTRRGSYVILRIGGGLTSHWFVVSGSYAVKVGKPINVDGLSQ